MYVRSLLFEMQGPAKSKKTPEADNGEESQTVSNGSHVTNENGCGEINTHPAVENKCGPEVPEKVEESNGADDPRPLKRGKPLANETCDSIKETNGQL